MFGLYDWMMGRNFHERGVGTEESTYVDPHVSKPLRFPQSQGFSPSCMPSLGEIGKVTLNTINT